MIEKKVEELQAGDMIVAEMAQPNMVIMVEIEDGDIVITTQAGIFKRTPGVVVNIEEATAFSRTAWKEINEFWGNKEGDNRKFNKESLHGFVMRVHEMAELAEE